MLRQIITTKDGSHTVVIPDMKVTYHSIYGAIQESKHVFIDAGLKHLIKNKSNPPINIFEMGFGTGLNAFLTAIEAEKSKILINYTTIEQHPISIEEASALNYTDLLGNEELFKRIHECKWGEQEYISSHFRLCKIDTDLIHYPISIETINKLFHLIYYDAFAPSAQPELWTTDVFNKLYNMLDQGGVLVTYCSKGDVQRSLKAAGFKVEKLQGPPGKREMIRASKI